MENTSPSCSTNDHQQHELLEVDEEACRRAADIFRALGDASRLRLLAILQAGEMCVTEIADLTSEQISTVSQRLRLLRSERLVANRREGKHIFYSLADDHVKQLVSNALQHASE